MQHAPARELLHFIKNSPTCYHVTENIRQKLLANGYTELSERERWEVAPGGKPRREHDRCTCRTAPF